MTYKRFMNIVGSYVYRVGDGFFFGVGFTTAFYLVVKILS